MLLRCLRPWNGHKMGPINIKYLLFQRYKREPKFKTNHWLGNSSLLLAAIYGNREGIEVKVTKAIKGLHRTPSLRGGQGSLNPSKWNHERFRWGAQYQVETKKFLFGSTTWTSGSLYSSSSCFLSFLQSLRPSASSSPSCQQPPSPTFWQSHSHWGRNNWEDLIDETAMIIYGFIEDNTTAYP